jgi:hypothetical protein
MTTEVLTYQDQQLNVADLPNNIQSLVSLYDEAVDRIRTAEKDLIIADSASKMLLSKITEAVNNHLAPAAEETAEETTASAE